MTDIPENYVQISRVLDFNAILVSQALAEAGIQFKEKIEKEGSSDQFEMHVFYVPFRMWEKAASVADEAVNL